MMPAAVDDGNADVDRLFGLVDPSDDDVSASSFSSAASSSSSSSTSSGSTEQQHEPPPSTALADPLDAHLEQTKSYHRKRRREEAVNTAPTQPRPRYLGPSTVFLNTSSSAQLHPLFTAKPRQTATLISRTLSSSSSPVPSLPPTTTSSSPPPNRLLSDEQLEAALAPTPYYSRQGVQDFDQVMSANRSQVSAYVDLTAVAQSADYVQVPSFALGDGGVHGPHISDHSVHKSRHDGYWEERLRKLEAQQPREQYYANLLAFTPHPTPTPDPHTTTTNTTPSPTPSTYPPIFAGCLMYIDGRTEGASHLSAHSLSALIRLHGGRTSPLLSRTHTTHVIATNLTLSKHAKEMRQAVGLGKGRGSVVVVRPEWVRECIRRGKMLDEWPWRVVKDGKQRELTWSAAGIEEAGEEGGEIPAGE